MRGFNFFKATELMISHFSSHRSGFLYLHHVKGALVTAKNDLFSINDNIEHIKIIFLFLFFVIVVNFCSKSRKYFYFYFLLL
jgi:hypothetical protein